MGHTRPECAVPAGGSRSSIQAGRRKAGIATTPPPPQQPHLTMEPSPAGLAWPEPPMAARMAPSRPASPPSASGSRRADHSERLPFSIGSGHALRPYPRRRGNAQARRGRCGESIGDEACAAVQAYPLGAQSREVGGRAQMTDCIDPGARVGPSSSQRWPAQDRAESVTRQAF